MAVPPQAPGDEAADALVHTCEVELLFPMLHELEAQPGAIRNDQALRFFEVFSLDSLFRVFSASALSSSQEACVLSMLTKLLHTDAGRSLLPQAMPYLDAASQSPKAVLRRLAAQQYAGVLQDAGADKHQQLLIQLLKGLQDPDTGVAHECELSLAGWAAADPARTTLLLDPATAQGQLVAQLAASASGTVRARALSLLAAVAAKGGAGVAEAVASAGLLQPLLTRELSSAAADPLSALSALNTVSELARSSHHAAGVLAAPLCRAVVQALPALASDPSLRPGALSAAAALLREHAELDRQEQRRQRHARQQQQQQGPAGGPMAADETGYAHGALLLELAAPLMQLIRSLLDEAGTGSAEDEEAALDAAGQLAGSWSGAELVLGDAEVAAGTVQRALGRTTPSAGVRIAALHALATAAGLERATQAAEDGEGPDAAAAAALASPSSEQALRVLCYTATAPGSPTEAVLALAWQPIADVAVASYRAACALALRPWFAAEVCSRPELLSRLTDVSSATGREASEWRHATVTSLWTTAQAVSRLPPGHPDAVHKAALAGALSRIQESLKSGPYVGARAANTMHDTHLVATIP